MHIYPEPQGTRVSSIHHDVMDVDTTVLATRIAASPAMQDLVHGSFANGIKHLIDLQVLVQPIYARERPSITLLCAICAHAHHLPPDVGSYTTVTLLNPLFTPSASVLSLADTPSSIPGPMDLQYIIGSPFLCHTVTKRAGRTSSSVSTYLFGSPISPQEIDRINFQALNQHLMIYHPRDRRVHALLNYLGGIGRGFVSYEDFRYVPIHRTKAPQLSLLQHQRELPTQPDVAAADSFSQCHFCAPAETELVRRSLNPIDYPKNCCTLLFSFGFRQILMLSANICTKITILCQLITYLFSRVKHVSAHFCTHTKRTAVVVLIGPRTVYSVKQAHTGRHPLLEVLQLYQTLLLRRHPPILNRLPQSSIVAYAISHFLARFVSLIAKNIA